ncbi:membrane protein [Klebsiella pneumoniae]|uniref:Membrane protein n=1 Tax=Klebsiella pneumoniae TaxID=573 RepID=A0A4P0Y4T8_KLEPN|nr:membrane protein [Klebsiella pneumoniae]
MSWLVLALFIAVVVQTLSIMLSGRYPYLAIVLAFVGGIVMVPASVIFLVGSLFSLQTRLTPDLRLAINHGSGRA